MDNSGVTYNLQGTVSGVFFTKRDADAAYQALLDVGHTHEDISVLMSDETLNNQKSVYIQDFTIDEANSSAFEKTKDTISNAIISITSMISLPGLGIAISNKIFKKLSSNEPAAEGETVGSVVAFAIPETHALSYGDGMSEGGIIISVDPRSAQEKRAIVAAFKENNGHDILGDDGYTELG